jgi:glucokinase
MVAMPQYINVSSGRRHLVNGRPSGTFAGVDFGGTKIAAVLADERGSILAEGVIPTQSNAGPSQAVRRTCKLLEDLCRDHSVDYHAIGIGLPGLVDRETGTIVFLPNLPEDWRGFPIAREFASYTGKPVALLNDARMATLGEFTFGSGHASKNMLFVTVGTGIGGGLVLDGRLHYGAFGAAGEIGHHTILPEGPLCTCGSRGCLETLVSGPALAAVGRGLMREGLAPRLCEIVAGDPDKVTASQMAQAAERGDIAVAKAIRRSAEYLGIGIANAVTISAVDNVIIGGGLVVLGELLLAPIRDVLRSRVRMFPAEVVRVSCSFLGAKGGALGGVALAMEEYMASACSLTS